MTTRFALGLAAFALAAARLAAAPPDGAPAAGGEVVVALHAAAAVDDANVVVGAVAAVRGGDAPLRERIARLDLVEIPRPGQAVPVSREQIAYRIQIAGIDPRRFRVEGPATATVKRNRGELTEEDLVTAAREAVLRQFPGKPDDVTTRLAQPVRIPVLAVPPGGDVRLAPEMRGPQGAAGQVRVEVGVHVNGERQTVIPVLLQVLVRQQIAVATRKIERGEILTADVVRAERRAVEGASNYLPYAECLPGKRAAQVIAAGQALGRSDVEAPSPAEEPVLVHTRETVRLVARLGAVRVTAVGEAQQDGRAGQTIRVRNVDSNRIVAGRVIEAGVVEVDY